MKPIDQDYVDLGRIAFTVKNNPKEGELARIDKILESISNNSVSMFLFRKGYFYEMGRMDRVYNKSAGIITIETIKDVPKSYPEQSDESQINELQIMYDLGYDNPHKYENVAIYYMTSIVLTKLEKIFIK